MMQYAAVMYLLWTTGCSIWYLTIISPNLDNDLFWPDFAATGAQTFLIDLFARPLGTTLELYGSAIPKTYGTASTGNEMKTTYPRALALAELTTVKDAIESFQTLDSAYTFNLVTQYCWVDFDRRWEVAHTLVRQRRCNAKFTANGAVYFEGILRNVDWGVWAATYEASFMFSVGNAVKASPGGAAWLAALPDAAKSVASEVAYWTTKGITSYKLAWSNDIQIGMLESVAIFNIFDQTQYLTTSNIPFVQRGPFWTTYYDVAVFSADLVAAAMLNGSYVRSAANFYGNMNKTLESLISLYPFTPNSIVIHEVLGPFQSIDLYLEAPPASLVKAVLAFDATISAALQTDEVLAARFTAIPSATLDPVPRGWLSHHLTYFGGIPFCALVPGAPFVQASFSFADSCTMPGPIQQGAATCDLCVSLATCCNLYVDQVSDAVLAMGLPQADTKDVFDDVTALGVEIVQFAMVASTSAPLLLRQPLLGGEWAFFGYAALYDWVYGLREVVSFHGDVSTVVLMSERVETLPLALSGHEIPRSTCLYLWYLAIVTTVMLAVVAAALVALTILRPQNAPITHLLHFNRIVGPVWVGRPFLLGRGLTAIIALSSAPIGFKATNGFGVFHAAPKSVLASLLTASESTWISFVISDVLLVATGHYTKWYAPLGSLLAGLATFCVNLASPVAATATLNRSCARNNVDVQLTCTRGTVQIGFPQRAALMLVIQLVSLLFAFLIVRFFLDRRIRPPPPYDVPYIIPASVLAFSEAPSDIWTMHPVLAVLSGYVHVRNYIFDIKQWMVFRSGFVEPVVIDSPHIKFVEIPTH
ncbi:hypothetical protein ACHHYP_04652, partial [Achlya hypogyna]